MAWNDRSKAQRTTTRTTNKLPPAGNWQSQPSRGSIAREAIAKRAYEKWQSRGCPHGDDMRDWFEAERELSSQKGRN